MSCNEEQTASSAARLLSEPQVGSRSQALRMGGEAVLTVDNAPSPVLTKDCDLLDQTVLHLCLPVPKNHDPKCWVSPDCL